MWFSIAFESGYSSLELSTDLMSLCIMSALITRFVVPQCLISGLSRRIVVVFLRVITSA